MYIGGDHYNNGIQHGDLQIYCHRVYAKLPYDLSDDDLRHRLYTDVFKWSFYTRDDLCLKTFLADCKKYNVIPVVNNNPTFLDPDIPIEEYARRGRILDQLIYDAGFGLAYNSHMNEPGKRHSTQEYVQYCKAANSQIKHYKTISGNDEYNMLDWNYLLDNDTSDTLGVHPLSSLGYPPNWQMLKNWAVMATARGVPYMITEGGSWFKSYFSAEGYQVIKNTILKAKALGYLATLIVLLDMNEGNYPKLGFRRWDKSFENILVGSEDNPIISDYWDDFINLVNTYGQKYQEVFEMYGIEINYVKPGSHNEETRAAQQIMLDEGYDLEPFGADSWYGDVTEDAIRKWQEDNNLKVDGWVGKETWQWIMENINTGTMRFMQMIARTGRYK